MRRRRVVHPDVRPAGRLRGSSLHDHDAGSIAEGVGYEPVGVDRVAGSREECTARHLRDLARVDAEPVHLGARIAVDEVG